MSTTTTVLKTTAMSKSNLGKLKYEKQFTIDEYNEMYKELKEKYSKQLIENWCECTDPSKFVHEDLGIASYLLLLWKDQHPCNFVDLGCGNGLLVYLLTQEGHVGKGLDVRRRKIWDYYPPTTILQEQTVIPSSASSYPEADWLIGNHSDELTAWLPIMAARSNSFCQFFTIPCCPYKLNGAKFQRRRSNMSVYQDFLEYVQEVGEICGYDVTADKMRIPSTKRICLIGRRHKLDGVSSEEVDDKITKFIASECPEGVGILSAHLWIGDFKPRDVVEPVRNCSQIPKEIQNEIVRSVSEKLLSSEQNILLKDGRSWNKGGNFQISEVASSISAELLQKLRLECKGLQTLLKNHHQVFEVKHGMVSFRNPTSLLVNSEAVRKQIDFKWKQKICWFHVNHPNGCPLQDEDCSYRHTSLTQLAQ